VPPLKEIEDNSVDFVVSFQVIEHINDDEQFLQEIHRVLKPGGKVILTTPNIMMSITRSPWHTREYTTEQMGEILESSFDKYELKGVFGNEKVMDYYNKNKESVRKITRFDILNMQYWLPRWMLEIPYDILNRFNRQNLQDDNEEMVNTVVHTDYSISESNNECLDHFCIATK
jgi:2-polyprenyl-3-methyl-5-hydroxy-6-metoxy-1,4-benzoquinol methylase